MQKIYSTLIFCFLYAALNVSGAALIKKELNLGVHKLDGISGYFTFLFTVRVIVGFAFVFLSALVLFKGLEGGNFSFVSPVATGINFVLTAVVSYLVFSERITITTILGFALILVGIFIVTLANKTT